MKDEIVRGIADFDCLVKRTDNEPRTIALADFVTDDLAGEDVDDVAKVQFCPVEYELAYITDPKFVRSGSCEQTFGFADEIAQLAALVRVAAASCIAAAD